MIEAAMAEHRQPHRAGDAAEAVAHLHGHLHLVTDRLDAPVGYDEPHCSRHRLHPMIDSRAPDEADDAFHVEFAGEADAEDGARSEELG